MITFNVGNGHTGDLVVALPVAQGLLNSGHDIEVVMPQAYYEPIRWCKIPRVDYPTQGSNTIKPVEFNGRHRTYDWVSGLSRINVEVEIAKFKLEIEPNTKLLPNGDWALLQPWCEDYTKLWHLKGWQAVVDCLNNAGMKVAIGGPSQFSGKAERLRGITNLCGLDKKDWARTVAAADLVVSIDSGAAHVADALGIPTIVLFGRTDPYKWGPFWDSRFIVKALRMKDINTDEVVETVNRALNYAN